MRLHSAVDMDRAAACGDRYSLMRGSCKRTGKDSPPLLVGILPVPLPAGDQRCIDVRTRFGTEGKYLSSPIADAQCLDDSSIPEISDPGCITVRVHPMTSMVLLNSGAPRDAYEPTLFGRTICFRR